MSETLHMTGSQCGSAGTECSCTRAVSSLGTEQQGAGIGKEIQKLIPGTLVFIAAVTVHMWMQLPYAWATPLLFVCSYLLVGWDVAWKGVRSLISRTVLDEFVLMTLATLGALAIGAYAEAVAVMLFYKVGELFQEAAVRKSRHSVASLLKLRPDTARVLRQGQVQVLDPAQVQVGEVIQVQPGARVPLDGTVLTGHSQVDTSALTGESVPRDVQPEQSILSGTINLSGLLTVRVDKSLAESTVSVILDLVQNSAQRKAPTEQFMTKVARVYTPVVVGLAGLIAFGPTLISQVPGGATLFSPELNFGDWVYRGLVFLVISCPCALVISIPLGFFGGIGAGSKNGILIKGANFLEGLNQLRAVVWDKTGTLTQGSFTVSGVEPEPGYTSDQLLAWAAQAEQHSTHPIARAIVRAAEDLPQNREVQEVHEVSGQGVRAVLQGREILVGSLDFLRSQGLQVQGSKSPGSQVYVAADAEMAGRITVRDAVRPQAKEAVAALKRLGVKTQYMLTGDSREEAERVSRELGLDQVAAELLPQDKVARMESIMEANTEQGLIAFVGDGINDAPVLARSDIGVAMGGLGSDAAIEAADVVLMRDDPHLLAQGVSLAARTRNIVWQNIVLALGIKAGVLALGALGLASMWAAVFADVGVALLAIGNSLRVMR